MATKESPPPYLEAYKCTCDDVESVVSPSAYLADLLDYVATTNGNVGHVKGSNGRLSIADLDDTFYQPFGELSVRTATAEDTVRHVRLSVEILLRYLADDDASNAGIPPQSETESYRHAAYDALLDQWDVLREDLRTAAYNPDEREWVADAIGIPESVVADLWLDPDAPLDQQYANHSTDPHTSLFESTDLTFPVSEVNLEDLFGLPAVTKADDEGRTPTEQLRTLEEPYIHIWRTTYLRNSWFEADHPTDAYPVHLQEDSQYSGQAIDGESTTPIIDPDVIGPDDFRVRPEELSFSWRDAFPSDDNAFSLWIRRRKWLDSHLESLWRKTPATPEDSDEVRSLLNDMRDSITYEGQNGERIWYSGLQNKPPEIPATPPADSQDSGPFAGLGFLEDFGRLHRQLTGDTETATAARKARERSQYPTGDEDDSPAAASRSVITDELNLSERTFVRLVELLETYYAEDETVEPEEWWQLTSICAGACKRSLYDVWSDEEQRSRWDVHLDRKRFWQSRREPQEGDWSFRLNKHDPIEPEATPAPHIDPERMDRSDLPDGPRGETARSFYDDRQKALAEQRQSLTDAFEDYRRELQSKFDSLVADHDQKLQDLKSRIPSDGSIPTSVETTSVIDGILDDEYTAVSWPSAAGSDWETRFEWIQEGLQLIKKKERDGSTLTIDQQEHVDLVLAQLDDLRVSAGGFRQLNTLREQAKLSDPEGDGLSPAQIVDVFAVLPLGNPLDPVLTAVYEPKNTHTELAPIYNDPATPPRWAPLFTRITKALEDESGGGQQDAGPPELEALGLSTDEFESVLALRRRSRPSPDGERPSESLVSEVIKTLTSAWKRNKHYTSENDSWLTIERDHDNLDHYWEARKAKLPKWRTTRAERSEWQQALIQRSSAPIVDPDLIRDVDDFETPAWEKDAFDVWKHRKNFLFGSEGTALVSEIEQLRTDAEQGNQITPSTARNDIDTALQRIVGVTLSDLHRLAEEMQRGDSTGVRLARLDLTSQELSYILELDENLGSQPIRVEEWESLKNILLQVWKQRQYGRWNREERAHQVVLEPDQFDLPDSADEWEDPDEDDPRRWRVEWSVRKAWEDTLKNRIDQLDAVDEEIEAAVAAAESEALPVFREVLIEQSAAGGGDADYEQKAEWLSERLLIDTEMHGGRETTRTSQAITSLQTLLQSIDLHLDEMDNGLATMDLRNDDAYFHNRWRWLGSYGRWKAAMGVYVYPQNVLLPTLRRRKTTPFDTIANRLSRASTLTRSTVSSAMADYAEYLQDIMSVKPRGGCMAPGPVVGQRSSDEPEAVAYAFGESEHSGDYYYMAFDPENDNHPAVPDTVDSPWTDNSTWQRIPLDDVQMATEFHGAATYQEEIYLFLTIEDSSENVEEQDVESDSDGSGKTLQYVRYDVRSDRWHEPMEIEFPDEEETPSATYEMGDEAEIEDVTVVVTEGWESPPVVALTLRGPEADSSYNITKDFLYYVLFQEDGTPEGPEEYQRGSRAGGSHDAIVRYSSEYRVEFGTKTYIVVDIESDAIKTVLRYPETESNRADAVFPRPSAGDAILVSWDGFSDDDDTPAVSRIRFDESSAEFRQVDSGPLSGYSQIQGLTDEGSRGLILCNNVVARPTNRRWESNEVFLGARTTDDEGEASKPVTVEIRPRLTQTTVGVERDLAPEMFGSGSDSSPWRFSVDPEKASTPLEEAAQTHRTHAEDARSATSWNQQIYVEEAYYFLPLLIARKHTQVGNYEEALRWFRTIYDYSQPSSDRAIWPPLDPSETSLRQPMSPRGGWLIDPIDPHSIASMRSRSLSGWGAPYTQFTLFSLIQCFSDYGDDEYAKDTAKSVANATDLYEQAEDLLESAVLRRQDDPCRSLIETLKEIITAHVFRPKIWEETPELSKEDVEAQTDEVVRIVEDIDDYSNRRQAIGEIHEHLRSGDLYRALDVAHEWEDHEQDEPTFKERLVDSWEQVWPDMYGFKDIERQLVTAADLIGVTEATGEAIVPGSGTENVSERDFAYAEWLESAASDTSIDNIDVVGLVDEGDASATPNAAVDPNENPDTSIVDDIVLDDGYDGPTEAESITADTATLDILSATKHQFCIPENPLLQSLRRHVEVNLEKIRSGRNIAGMKRDIESYSSSTSIESATPTPEPGGGIGTTGGGPQPTNYRYETLIERAKELADQAHQFERELLTSVEQAEREELKLRRARQQVELADERVSLQDVRMDRAEEKVQLARLKRERARIRRDKYEQWINNPLVKNEEKAMNHLQTAVVFQHVAAGLHVAAAGSYLASQLVKSSSMQVGEALEVAGNMSSSLAAASSAEASALSTQAQVFQIEARKERRKRRWRLKKDLAKQNLKIGSQQIDIAKSSVDIVQQEREIAKLRGNHAKDIVNFHENKFTNDELYHWIANVLEGVYKYFLQQAAAVAKMAQRQLAFKRQGLPRTFIRSDYWEAPTQGQTTVPARTDDQRDDSETDRRGMTGSSRLLQDIYELDQHEFRTDRRRLQVEKTISVSELDPMALQEFRETGVLSFATTLGDFNDDHPGHYHRMIEDVDVRIVALTPATGGINATLRNGGTSSIVVGDTLYQKKTIDRNPERVVLNRARGDEREQEVLLRPQNRNKLRPFEHSGVETEWELEMARPANDMDYSTIRDVQLEISYSALESYEYRQQILAEMDPERTIERSYSFQNDFADAWYELTNASDLESTTVQFDTDREDFSSNLFDLSLDSGLLYFVVSGPNREDELKNLTDLKVEFGPVDGTKLHGKATNGIVDINSFDTDGVDQDWQLTVTSEALTNPFSDGTIEDVLFIVAADGETADWPR